MSEPFLGEIKIVGFNFPPRGWAFCEGQLLPISQNTALFSLLGTTYGGDGRTTFALPDLRGRSPISPGSGPGLPTVRHGARGGVADSILPRHTHTATSVANAVAPGGNTNDAVGNFWADDFGTSSGTYHTGDGVTPAPMNPGAVTTTLDSVGDSGENANYHPHLAVYFCIALVGIFPSRS